MSALLAAHSSLPERLLRALTALLEEGQLETRTHAKQAIAQLQVQPLGEGHGEHMTVTKLAFARSRFASFTQEDKHALPLRLASVDSAKPAHVQKNENLCQQFLLEQHGPPHAWEALSTRTSGDSPRSPSREVRQTSYVCTMLVFAAGAQLPQAVRQASSEDANSDGADLRQRTGWHMSTGTVQQAAGEPNEVTHTVPRRRHVS